MSNREVSLPSSKLTKTSFAYLNSSHAPKWLLCFSISVHIWKVLLQIEKGKKIMQSLNKLERSLVHIKLERSLSIQSCFPERNSDPSSATSPFQSGGNITPNEEPNYISRITTSSCFQEIHVDVDPAEVSFNMLPKNPASVLHPLPERQFFSLPLPGYVNGSAAALHQSGIANWSAPAALPTPRTKRTTNLIIYVPLYQAALKGDWDKAKEFICLHPHALNARITKGWETALHIGAGARQTKFVEELVKFMDAKDLALQNKYDNTALCFAAISGITRIAEVMVKKNKNLPAVRGSQGVTPLHMAALLGHREMVWFLYSVTDDKALTKEDYTGLLIATISSDLYDVALEILWRQPESAIQRDPNGETALHVLARKPSAFSGKNQLGFWQRGIREVRKKKLLHMQALKLVRCLWEQVLLLDDSQIGDLLRSPSRLLFVAVEFGNFEFIVELIRSYPDLIWKVDEQSQSIFHIAVEHRQEKIFKLIYDIGAHKDLITSYKNKNSGNMLHLAGKLAPSNRLNIVSGAALQMQRELLWFKEVEKNVPPLYREMRDTEGRTPRMLFTEEHKGLVKAGERWMKDTASSCMLLATLITTVMFAAIFTVPGGNSNKGTPIFLQTKSFLIFAISDAFALFSSVTSILMFLSILTSRYAEEDFLESLPKKLIIGLTTLFFSIASMLVAFSATFFIVLGHQIAWTVIPVALTACIPVTLFAFLQFPLLADTLHSTYGEGIFAQQCEDMLY